MIAAGLTLRVRPGLGIRLNIALIGFGADRIFGERRDPARATLWSSRATGSPSDASVRVMGLGPGLYIRARLGADRRDGLTLGLHPLTEGRIGRTRGLLELCGAGCSFALGGSLDAGARIFALGIGRAGEFGLRLFGVPLDRETTRPRTICARVRPLPRYLDL